MDQESIVEVPDQVRPTLESLPRELQLQICREMLRSENPIELSPYEPCVFGFAFGSLGILRVSKHFSTMALSVMYAENCFRLDSMEFAIEDDYFEDEGQNAIDIETLKSSPWKNLRDVSSTIFGNVLSSVDCLDMISQTSSGQTFLKHLHINFGPTAWMRLMDGVLLCILKRMRGLQSVNLELGYDWNGLIRDPPHGGEEEWQERNARDLLLLIKEKLSHIKEISIGLPKRSIREGPVESWMAHELKKRSEAWVPPLPTYKNFRRTFSPMSIMSTEVTKSVVEAVRDSRPEDHEGSPAYLERKYGVF